MVFDFFSYRIFGKQVNWKKVAAVLTQTNISKKELLMDIVVPALASVTALLHYRQNIDAFQPPFRCSHKEFKLNSRQIVFLLDNTCEEFQATLENMGLAFQIMHPYLTYLSKPY